MDFTMLSRIQFGFTIGFQYLFAVSTLGLSLYILVFEALYVIRKEEVCRDITDFLVKILTLVFTFGVATGFMMPAAFGANWSRFSSFAGPVFGIHLAMEGTTAFALEAVSLAVLLFGRNRISARLYLASAFVVFFAAHLSAFWIVSANSWMQTPAGFAIEDGRMVLTSLFHAVFNPSAPIRIVHVIIASWITGSAVVAGIAAYYLLKNLHVQFSTVLLSRTIVPFFCFALLQLFVGHFHVLGVLAHSPVKEAAYEGIFQTTNGAPLYAFGIPDEKNGRIHCAIGLPYMLSFLETGRFDAEVKGLNDYPKEDWPPVNVIFTTFHLMCMCGMSFILIGLIGVFLLYKKRLFESRWYLFILLCTIPLTYLANQLGWIGTEIGRQPWMIYQIQKTSDAATTSIPAAHAVVSLSFIACFYLVLAIIFLKQLATIINKGPRITERREA